MSKIGIITILVLIIGGYFALSKNNMSTYKNSGEDIKVASKADIAVTPIEHATMVLTWGDKIIYTDPVGGSEAFAGQSSPDVVLLTDIHSDHLNIETLQAVVKAQTVVVAPQAVVDQIKVALPGTMVVLKNGETTTVQGFSIEAIPMYNLPESAQAFHVKGRGNGYLIEAGEQKVYISGDTAGIPEMRNLKNIDLAFVAMNLPYTMNVEDAAEAVLAFKPRRVTPYHYRGPEGFSDTSKFRNLVNTTDPNIEVDLIDFYPKD
jgi:L-ascorbate metabolism protein UlaG (beta-lactamase superfamily)